MNLTVLRAVFANWRDLKKKEVRGANTVFRGVAGQMRALEFEENN